MAVNCPVTGFDIRQQLLRVLVLKVGHRKIIYE
jgi:hypothetical protein